MAQKEFTLKLYGPEEIMDPAIIAFCKQNGWTEKVFVNGEEIDNPTTLVMKTREVMRAFILETVKAWNISQAREQAARQASIQTETAITNGVTLEISM